MESFKRPEMIVSVVTATGLIGSIIYFYKQESALREKLKEISEHLTTTVNKVRDIQKDVQINAQHIVDIVKAIQELQTVVNKHAEIMKEFERLIKLFQEQQESQDHEINDLRETVDTMVSTLQDQGITFDFRPKGRKGRDNRKAKKKPVRKAKEIPPSREDDDDSSDEESSSSEEEVVKERPTRARARNDVDDTKGTFPARKKNLTSGRVLERIPNDPSSVRRAPDPAPPQVNKLLAGIGKPKRATDKADKTDTAIGSRLPTSNSEVIEEANNPPDSDEDSGDDIADEVAKVQELQKNRKAKRT